MNLLKIFLLLICLLAVCLALLSVRIFFGRKFVHTHIDGNKALNAKGIRCVKTMDKMMRDETGFAVKEK